MEYIYCGGRFDFDYRQIGYEKKAAEDYRAILLKDVNKLLNPADTVVLSDNLVYIGPYYFETEGMLDLDIIETEKRQIERCTVAVFLLDHSPCPGTIAEMVYAASLHKRMIIFYVKDENETESTLLSPFWYPMILCRKLNPADTEIESCDSFSEGRSEILKWLKSSLY